MAIETGKYRTRRLDENGDFVISGKVWIYDIEAVTQTINTRLKLFSAEYWRDVTEGTPWIKDILTKNNSRNTLQSKTAILKNRINNTDGVVSIIKWESDFNYSTRKFTVNADILTEFGVVSVNQTV